MKTFFVRLLTLGVILSLLFTACVSGPSRGPAGLPLAASGAGPYALNVEAASQLNPNIKNIIIFIPDGTPQSSYTLARWLKAYDPATGRVDPTVRLSFDDYNSALIRTWWQSHDIIGGMTDSAPAATAYATGVKTNDRFIGVDYHEHPRVTTFQAARLIGKGTGIVANSNLQHATPGGFTAHTFNRSWFCTIGEQQVYGLFDVMLGGGSDFLIPANRQDGEDIIASARALGYQVVKTRDEMAQVTSGKILGLFAGDYLAFHLDKPHLAHARHQPTLTEMTRKAIDVLSQNRNGFILMVEDSIADWSNHANDPVATVTNLLEFDRAVQIGLEFAKNRQDTLVLVFSDHGAGGFTLGSYVSGGYTYGRQSMNIPPARWTYPTDPVQNFVAPLARARMTANGVGFLVKDNPAQYRQIIAQWFGINDLTAEEDRIIQEYIRRGFFAEPWGFNYALGGMISRRADLGWTTFGHTGEEVNLFSYFPGGSKLTGTIENTDIAHVVAGIWGQNLDALTRRHFVDAEPAFRAKGATVEIQNANVRSGGVMVVTRGSTRIEIPENKNFVIKDGQRIPVDLVNVHSPRIGKFFVNQSVIDLLR